MSLEENYRDPNPFPKEQLKENNYGTIGKIWKEFTAVEYDLGKASTQFDISFFIEAIYL